MECFDDAYSSAEALAEADRQALAAIAQSDDAPHFRMVRRGGRWELVEED